MAKLDAETLQAALIGYQHQYSIIEQKIAEIKKQMGARGAAAEAGESTTGRGRMSPAARARIAAAQKKRWAAFHASTGGAKKAAPQRASRGGKRRISAEGRRRIAEATRKRWEAYRAAKGKG